MYCENRRGQNQETSIHEVGCENAQYSIRTLLSKNQLSVNRPRCPVFPQILGYINPWLTLKGPGATSTVAREVLDVFMGLLLMSNRVSQANRCVSVVGMVWSGVH